MNISPHKVVKLREARGWHQAEFARRCGLSRAYVSLVELGERNPSPPAVRAMAEALEISMDSLITADLVECPNCHTIFDLP